MNNELEVRTLELPYTYTINLDSIEEIIVEINGKEIKLDKEKLEKFLSNLCDDNKTKKVKYYAIYKKLGFIDGVSEFVCFVESEYVAIAICKNDRYSYEEIEKEIEVD